MQTEKRPMLGLDIETLTLGQRSNEYVDNQPVKLGNVKNPEKIAAKEKEAKEKANSRHALSWHLGRVLCIGLVDVFDQGALNNLHGSNVYYGANSGEKVIRGYSPDSTDNEVVALRLLHDVLRGVYLIGKNSKNFDFPFLIGRYMANNLPVPSALKQRNRLFDVDDFFGYSSMSTQRAKLDAYAHGLEIEGKSIHGGYVEALFNGKRWDELEEYCLNDTRIVAEMARRYWGSTRDVASEGGLV